VPGQHPGEQRVLLRELLPGLHGGDQPDGLALLVVTTTLTVWVRQQLDLVPEARAVEAKRVDRGDGRALTASRSLGSWFMR